MATSAALRLDFVQPGIARITFDTPDSRANTLHQGVQTEFENVLTQLEQTPSLLGVILCSGKPGMFIAGADLKELASVTPGAAGTPGDVFFFGSSLRSARPQRLLAMK